MGHKPTYNKSWNAVYHYLEDPGNLEKHRQFYNCVEPLIKHWLLRLGIKTDLEGHAKSIFSDLFVKELKRYRSGKLLPVNCTAQVTSYYYPVIRNLCIDYVNVLNSRIPLSYDTTPPEPEAIPGVFDSLWGEHKNTVLLEMNRSVSDYIEYSNYEPLKKEFLRKRFIQGKKILDILNGVDKREFEAQRKWICRQGKKIASLIANKILPAIIDCYRLPINRHIDPKIIEKHLLGAQTKAVV
ncbi:hypothetical protein [Poritiphilus flavus]|uniref:Uncharacterized protein n=1 Tax=Poritiphilus flavus TaxID=2697053 RepID=A0A6L9ECE6_9FLAO|nr:hypothetical protein [Poritiphilus flavus]NAS12410.1 hypothetical protein [Poritiphilus flavus]